MIDYLKLLIRNPNTNEQLWFEYPFDMDKITKALHIQGDAYTIIDSNSSMPVYSYDNIECIVEDYDEFVLLPEYIKTNINKILGTVDGINDIFTAVNENRVNLYTGCDDKYDYARELLKSIHGVPDEAMDYIDFDKYLDDVAMDTYIIETPDGIIEIKY